MSDEAWAWLRVRSTIRRCIEAAAKEHMRLAEELIRRAQLPRG